MTNIRKPLTADDPRHGTEAGYSAHTREGIPQCKPCERAKARGDKRRRVLGSQLVAVPPDVQTILRRHSAVTIVRRTGVSICAVTNLQKRGSKARAYPSTIARIRALRVPTDIGVVRRIQALTRLGWSAPEIAARSGIHFTTIARLRDRSGRQQIGDDRLRDAIADAYEAMCMTVPPLTRHTSRLVKKAEANGWPPPLAWGDIDNPKARPIYGSARGRRRTEVDEVVIDRILNHSSVPDDVTQAERREVVRRWRGDQNELERLTGWNVSRIMRETRDDVAELADAA